MIGRVILALFKGALTLSTLALSYFLSVGFFSAGIGTDSQNVRLVGAIWLVYFVGGFVIGSCWPRAWYASVGVAWLAIILTPLAIIEMVSGQQALGESVFSAAAVMFLVSPLIALIGGYIGAKCTQRILAWFEYENAFRRRTAA